MGRIYRIRHQRYRSHVDPAQRGFTYIVGFVLMLACFAVEALTLAGFGGVSGALIFCGLFFFFFVGLFWDDYPKPATAVIRGACVLAALLILAVTAYALYYLYVLSDQEPPDCVSDRRWDACDGAIERFEELETTRRSPVKLLLDLMPLGFALGFYALVFWGANKGGRDSSG